MVDASARAAARRARGTLDGLVMPDGISTWGEVAADFQLADAEAVMGEPRYHFITRGRGGSKTSDLAAMAVALMTSGMGADDQCYAVAADRDQALLLIDECRHWAQRSELEGLNPRLTFFETGEGCRLKPLAADSASSWGLRPALMIIDELAQWPNLRSHRETWEACVSAAAKREDCRLIVLTSAGQPSHWSHAVLEQAKASPQWRVHEEPGPAPWVSEELLDEQRRLLPEASFARLWLNQWTESTGSRLTTLEDVLACVGHRGALEPGAARYVIGVDLGVHHDRSVMAVAHMEDSVVVVDDVRVWHPPVLLDVVEDAVVAASRRYRSAPVVVDPWQAVGMMQRWRSAGVSATEHIFTAPAIDRLAMTMYRLIAGRRIRLPDDDDLVDELANLALVETKPGMWRMDHDSDRHDDQAVAVALAATSLLERPYALRSTTGPVVERRPAIAGQPRLPPI